MLNAALPVSIEALPAVAAPGSAPPLAETAPGFAQVLDQASARLHDAPAGDAAANTTAELARALAEGLPAARMRDGAKPDIGPSAGGMRKAPVAAEQRVQTRAAVAPQTPAASAAEDLAAAPAPPEQDRPADDDADMQSAELAAWVSSLPLPPSPSPPPPAAMAAAQAAPVQARAARDPHPATAGSAALQITPALQTTPEAAARDQTATPAAACGTTVQAASARRSDTPAARGATSTLLDGATSPVQSAGGAAHWTQALATPAETAPASSRSSGDGAMAALLGGTPVAAPRPLDSGTALQVEVRAEVGTREFAPALGSQLAVLVRGGVEHAQLKLNPAELGPIEVRISVDGALAQVDFSAAHAHTRQALQEAVPALAGALREQGLTLTGGGVFDQPRESRGEARQDAPRGGPAGAEPANDMRAGSASAARLSRARGVVDLYA